MNPEELAAVAEALEQLRQGGTVSAETLNKLGGTTQTVNKALQGYAQKLVGATAAVGGMAKTVAEGEGSFKSLGGTISGLTSVIGKFASAIPLVGGAAQALAEGVGEAAKFVLDQLDTMAKNYQTLGDASAGAADGVDGLLRQFNQLGNYSLPAFAKAVRTNTVGLAAMRGTAAQGAEELSKVAGVLTTGDTANQFLKLGIGLDAVGDATARYLSDSSRFGTLQGATTDELIKKTQNYILEVDKIARLTGKTREDQAKEAQKSLLNARFRAVLDGMTAKGQGKMAEQLRMYAEGMGDAIGDVVRSAATGIPATKDVASANIFLNDAVRENVEAMKNGGNATNAIADTMRAANEGVNTFNDQVSFAGDIFGGVYTQASDLSKIYQRQQELIKDGLSPQEAITKAQDEQRLAAGKTTQEFVDAQLATAGASKNLQSLGFSLATAAIPAVNKFASALEQVTGYVNKNFGVGGTKVTPAGVDRGPAGGPRAGSRDLNTAVAAAIKEYEQVTGKTARITSGQRSREEQQRLYNEYLARGKTGMPVAPPGTSRHETGNAVDINQSAADDMARLGILQKYGLTRPVANDPVHVELAGPSNRYKSPMSDAKPPTAGDDTKAQAAKTQDQQVDSMSFNNLAKQLAILNQTNRDQLSVAKKQLAKTN
jgi:LAS superfamily LD-carboxypeptidase LdcB